VHNIRNIKECHWSRCRNIHAM